MFLVPWIFPRGGVITVFLHCATWCYFLQVRQLFCLFLSVNITAVNDILLDPTYILFQDLKNYLLEPQPEH